MEEIKVSKLWEDFENARAYQGSIDLTSQIPTNVDFYEGRQWPKKTEATRHIPRPVVNITRFIVRTKKSSIVGAPVSIVFTSNRNPDMAQKLTEFNKSIENEMEMDELRNKLVQEGVVKGTGILHYYWDGEARGELGDFEGGVRAEVIDPLNVFFANPQEQDEQKQKWIILASRVEVSAAREMLSAKYKKGGGEQLIQPDDADRLYTDEVEQEGAEICTVLTRYFRRDGEVYYERAVKQTMLHDAIKMTPPTEADAERELAQETVEKIDDGEDKLQDTPLKGDKTVNKVFTLYPIVVYQYEPREKSIYGIGEVEGIIPNQKAINFIFAMQLLSIQNLAWGKWIVKEGALGKQKLTNSPGQVIIDHTPYGVKGISRSDEPAISSHPMTFIDSLMSVTRLVTGSTEVMTGEAEHAGQSGQAIANLQAQALKPIQELRDRYLRTNKRAAKIIKQFYELFYDGKRFEYKTDDGQFVEDSFNGVEMQDAIFDITIEAGTGTPYSEALVVSLLTEYLGAGYIDYPTYLELLPAQIAVFKTTLLKRIKEGNVNQLKQAQEQIVALQEQLQQATASLQAMSQRLEDQGKTVDQVNGLINKNRAISKTLIDLYEEATAKLNQANAVIQAQGAENATVRRDAETMAQMMAEDEQGKMQSATEEAHALNAMLGQ